MPQKQADYLLKLPKKIIIDNTLQDKVTIVQQFPLRERYELLSENDSDVSFLWSIWQSSKDTLRISLHFQEDDSKIGLLRLDYGHEHTNPPAANENVPDYIKKHAGQRMMAAHVHYYVQGYKDLVWAVPLTEDEFVIKNIEHNRFYEALADIISMFAIRINIETNIVFNMMLL
jgi:hypothetical protein